MAVARIGDKEYTDNKQLAEAFPNRFQLLILTAKGKPDRRTRETKAFYRITQRQPNQDLFTIR